MTRYGSARATCKRPSFTDRPAQRFLHLAARPVGQYTMEETHV